VASSRWQLPVVSPITPGGLADAAVAALGGRRNAEQAVTTALIERFTARSIALTDSGTSALVLAFRLAAPRGSIVALPAYACVDLLAAAAYAGLRVRLFDTDPATLSPDLDSVRHALAEGATAIVVAHLYGYPADVPAVAALAAEHGATLIEDAAQHANGSLAGVPLGAHGPLSVLSFGRGKGITGGTGGALLSLTDRWPATLDGRPANGWKPLALATAQWLIGRPALYAVPASIPALRLGETIYHDAHEPCPLPHTAAALLRSALLAAGAARTAREQTAHALIDRLAGRVEIPRPIAGGVSGYLRLPVLATRIHHPAPRLGIVRTYPRPLGDEPAARPLLAPGVTEMPGARELCARLFSVPTHSFVTQADIAAAGDWADRSR
jgi:perosamine synthetase